MESNNNKLESKKAILWKVINDYRRKLMSLLTKNIGKADNGKLKTIEHQHIKKILVIRTNHKLGNLILTTPLIQELTQRFPNSEIDFLAKGNLSPEIYSNYSNIRKFYLLPRKPFNQIIRYCLVWIKVKFKNYDLVINAVKGSSSGKLLTRITNSKFKIYGDVDSSSISKNAHIAKNQIFNLRHLIYDHASRQTSEAIPVLDLKLKEVEKIKGENILRNIIENQKPTICIFTHATGSKCYSKEWWIEFYLQLKSNFPDFNILEILPIENISQIDFITPFYYSKDIREIAAVISNARLFIGADSGMMHLASSAKTTTIGLFSKSKIEKYEPYGNGSFAINTNNTGIPKSIELIRLALLREPVEEFQFHN